MENMGAATDGRWSLLAAFGFTAATNSLMFMSFSTTTDVSEEALQCATLPPTHPPGGVLG